MPEDGTPSAAGPDDLDDLYLPAEPDPSPFAAAADADETDLLPARRSRVKASREPPKDTGGKAKNGPPHIDEWQDFFSRTLIRAATNFYIEQAFRGIDEDQLTEREITRIAMSEDERDTIARPFAEVANKLKFTRRHGRTIIAFAGTADSVIALGIWFSRVSRIARKYRNTPREPRVSPRPGQANGNGSFTAAAGTYYSTGG